MRGGPLMLVPVPLVNEERIAAIARLLEESGSDLLVLYGDGFRKDFVRSVLNVGYAGAHAFVGVTRDRDRFAIFTDPWDFERARGTVGASGEHIEVELSYDPEDALRRRSAGTAATNVAVAGLELMETRFVEALGGSPSSATSELERMRMVKSGAEIDALSRAAELADRGYRRFVERAGVGVTEVELVAEVEAFLKSEGAEDNFMLLSSGGPEIRSMKPPTERRLVEGDLVATELTPQVDGYYAQICRTLVVGEPSAAQEDAFDVFFRAQRAGEAMLRPGVDISDVARAENDVFREAGLGEFTTSRYTRVRGHGLGLFVDEKPSLLEEVHCTVEKNMVLIAHPNTYLPTAGYIVFGDALVVTEDGCRSLSSTERKLFRAGED
jgi:Xaa-Pro aminopeptidase